MNTSVIKALKEKKKREICRNCWWFNQNKGDFIYGNCQKRAPELAKKGIGIRETIFPRVQRDDYCGEFNETP